MMPTPAQRTAAQHAMLQIILDMDFGIEGSMVTVAELAAAMVRSTAIECNRNVQEVLRIFTTDIINCINILEETD